MRAVGERLRPNSGCNRHWALHAKPFLDPASGKGGVLKDLVIELACKLVIEVVESAPFKEMVHHWVDSLLFYLLH
jgi:hypothetical protein